MVHTLCPLTRLDLQVDLWLYRGMGPGWRGSVRASARGLWHLYRRLPCCHAQVSKLDDKTQDRCVAEMSSIEFSVCCLFVCLQGYIDVIQLSEAHASTRLIVREDALQCETPGAQ